MTYRAFLIGRARLQGALKNLPIDGSRIAVGYHLVRLNATQRHLVSDSQTKPMIPDTATIRFGGNSFIRVRRV